MLEFNFVVMVFSQMFNRKYTMPSEPRTIKLSARPQLLPTLCVTRYQSCIVSLQVFSILLCEHILILINISVHPIYCRLYVLYRVSNLQFLDSSPVKSLERSEAKRQGPFLRVIKFKEEDLFVSVTFKPLMY